MTEARVTAGSAIIGRTVSNLTRLWGNEVTLTGIIRNQTERTSPLPDTILREDDIVLLEGDPEASNAP